MRGSLVEVLADSNLDREGASSTVSTTGLLNTSVGSSTAASAATLAGTVLAGDLPAVLAGDLPAVLAGDLEAGAVILTFLGSLADCLAWKMFYFYHHLLLDWIFDPLLI